MPITREELLATICLTSKGKQDHQLATILRKESHTPLGFDINKPMQVDVSHFFDTHRYDHDRSITGEVCLVHIAARLGLVETLTALHRYYGADLNVCMNSNFHESIRYTRAAEFAATGKVTTAGKDDLVDSALFSLTPLDLIIREGHDDCVETLRALGCKKADELGVEAEEITEAELEVAGGADAAGDGSAMAEAMPAEPPAPSAASAAGAGGAGSADASATTAETTPIEHPAISLFRDADRNDVLVLGMYYPTRFRRGEYTIPLKKEHLAVSNIIDELKRGTRWRKLETFLQAAIPPEFMIAVVPSSKANSGTDTSTPHGVTALARRIGRMHGTDATSVLVRTETINKLAYGGSRLVDIHTRTIAVENPDLVRGKKVLLVDDVITSGNSLLVCKQKLSEAGAASVLCFAIGQTFSGDIRYDNGNKHYLYSKPLFEHFKAHCRDRVDEADQTDAPTRQRPAGSASASASAAPA